MYSESAKNLAMNIYYISPSSYDFLRNKLNFNLPHHCTINRWAPIKNLQPGLINTAHDSLKVKCSELKTEDANHMVLLMDEMCIRKELKYNTHLDIIDGFENDGERGPKIGGYVCLFLLKSLFTNWSILVNYFVSEKGLCGEKLAEIVKENLKMLANLGVKVRVLVCDQGSSNRKCFSLLGVTVEKPYFNFQEKNIYCVYDFPHLVKSLRNGWLESDLNTPDGIVSFRVIKELWENELNSRTKMCLKLTRQHIFPNSFEKMRVKFATQVFSRTVQAAIRTIVDTVGFKTSSKELSLSTANFVLKIDQSFDCMNSCSLYSKNMYKSAIQIDNVAYKCIKTFQNYLDNVNFCDKKKRVFFLEGMKLSLNSTILMAQEFLREENSRIFFLMTKGLNKDKLENTFAVLRQKGGNNITPSVSEINNLLAKLMVTRIIQSSSSSNCENSEETLEEISDDLFANLEFVGSELPSNEEDHSPIKHNIDTNFDSEILSDMFLEDVFDNSSNINLEVVSIRYFAGYVAFKILPKVDCDNCAKYIRKEDEIISAPSELFLFHKNYQALTDFGNLLAPSDAYLNICKKHIIIFHRIFEAQPHKIHIKKYIMEVCKEATPEWFQTSCSEHREKFMDFMITVLLRKHCSWAISKGGTQRRKLKILKN